MERHFARSFDSLDGVFAFIEEYLDAASADPSLSYPVSFAVEELFTNMVKYNADGPDRILISIEPLEEGVKVSLVDYDSDPFDANDAPPAPVDAPLADRPVGGLGLHLIKHMVDSLHYEYANRRSTVSFTRKVGSSDVRNKA
ncbi:MAG: ATP-binding protein [Gammaproteobacteria bacterium]